MNFRVSIKQILARIYVAEKKKDLKVILSFKKEIIPFLNSLRQEGLIYKFTVQKKTIILCLKKTTAISSRKHKQKIIRDFELTAVMYRNPTALIFFSNSFGICTKSYFGQQKQVKAGGLQLFLTY
jgi:ribosomal protein S8